MAMSEDTRLALLEARLAAVERYLFGHDGNPGKIAKMDEKLDQMKEDMHKLRTSVLIIVATSASAGGGAVVYVVKALLGG
jgi:uncharacterized coiled-coil protein SlyX